GSSTHCPVCWSFLRLFTAKPNFATLPPLAKVRTSGSRVRRPISITLFRLAIGALSCARYELHSQPKLLGSEQTDVLYIRLPTKCKPRSLCTCVFRAPPFATVPSGGPLPPERPGFPIAF